MPLEQEAPGDVPPVAWAFWGGWRGPPELVKQVARRARWAVGSTDEERAAASCKMRVYVKADVEPIHSLDAFDTEVTNDALRNFTVIAIEVRGPRGRVDIHLARKPHADLGPPRGGVLVAVSESPDAIDVREVVARSVERRTGPWKGHRGEAATAADVRDAVAAAAPRELPHGTALKTAVTGIMGGVSYVATGGEEERVEASAYVSLFAVAGAVGVVWVVALLLIPRVEVQAVTRAKRAADLAYKGVGAALITALIGIAVKLVVGGDAN